MREEKYPKQKEKEKKHVGFNEYIYLPTYLFSTSVNVLSIVQHWSLK